MNQSPQFVLLVHSVSRKQVDFSHVHNKFMTDGIALHRDRVISFEYGEKKARWKCPKNSMSSCLLQQQLMLFLVNCL
jgi:hypothetical protein